VCAYVTELSPDKNAAGKRAELVCRLRERLLLMRNVVRKIVLSGCTGQSLFPDKNTD